MIERWYNVLMRFHLHTNPIILETVGAVVGMIVAVLIYLGFQQYSFGTLKGSLVETTASSSVASVTDATASLEAAAAERTANRDQLTQDRLTALANRHPTVAGDTPSVPSTTSAIDTPTTTGNLTTAVSTRERLAQRAARFPVVDRIGGSSTSATSETASAPREIAGVPMAPSEVSVTATASVTRQPTIIQIPVRRPLAKSGPTEDVMILLAFAGALTVMLRKRQMGK